MIWTHILCTQQHIIKVVQETKQAHGEMVSRFSVIIIYQIRIKSFKNRGKRWDSQTLELKKKTEPKACVYIKAEHQLDIRIVINTHDLLRFV